MPCHNHDAVSRLWRVLRNAHAHPPHAVMTEMQRAPPISFAADIPPLFIVLLRTGWWSGGDSRKTHREMKVGQENSSVLRAVMDVLSKIK